MKPNRASYDKNEPKTKALGDYSIKLPLGLKVENGF